MGRSDDFQSVRNRPLSENATLNYSNGGGFPKSWLRDLDEGQGGPQFLIAVLTHRPKTVGEVVRIGAATEDYHGRKMTEAAARAHLWWWYTEPRSCLEINGVRWPEIPQDAL